MSHLRTGLEIVLVREVVKHLADHIEYHEHHVGRHHPNRIVHYLLVAGMATELFEQDIHGLAQCSLHKHQK